MSIQKRKGILVTLIITMVLMATLLPAVQAASLADGTYTIGLKAYKDGTTEESRSASSVKTPADMVVSSDGIKVQVAFKNTSLADVRVGGSPATVVSTDGDWTTYEFTINDINATVPVVVNIPAMHSDQTIDLAFQGSTASLVKAAEDKTNDDTNTVNDENKDTTTDDTEKVTSPKTSDNFNGIVVSAVIIFAAGALYAVGKKLKALA